MYIVFWCPTCRELHSPGELRYLKRGSTETPVCPVNGSPVELRGLPDDPDDEEYSRPRCPTCRASLRRQGRFCTQCGTALEHVASPSVMIGPLDPKALPPPITSPLTEPLGPVGTAAPTHAAGGGLQWNMDHFMARLAVQFARKRVMQRQIARLLTLITTRPGWRTSPQPDDPRGDFAGWFDGGAMRQLTSHSEYVFSDGSRALLSDMITMLQIEIDLPGGDHVLIHESQATSPSFDDLLLTALVYECTTMLTSLRREATPGSGFGSPPAQCYLVQCGPSTEHPGAGPAIRAWLFDLDAHELSQIDDAGAELQLEPTDGMYYRRASMRFCADRAAGKVMVDTTVGPRFGRGFVFDIIEQPEEIQLENASLRWMS